MEPLLLLLLVKSQLRHRHPDGEETGYTTALFGLPSHDLLQSSSPFFTAEAPLSASPFLFLSFPSKTSQPLSPKNFPSEFFSVPATPLSAFLLRRQLGFPCPSSLSLSLISRPPVFSSRPPFSLVFLFLIPLYPLCSRPLLSCISFFLYRASTLNPQPFLLYLQPKGSPSPPLQAAKKRSLHVAYPFFFFF